ncbi:MAG: FAD-dependent oxidoreductase [Thermodesulfobacteriota bacterium]|nr:FAD-dependent oxidoreductase [Thermodesulfobacteriota bacterium]
MKRRKDRLHRVLVIGATPAGIAATNKLGELGIPVTLVDTDPDLDSKLSREEWRLDSGLCLNFAHRPGLIRILRNPFIRCILPAKVTSLTHTPQGFRARVKTMRTFVDPDRCTLCGRCAEICPATTLDGEPPILFNGRMSLPGRPVIDKRREPPCQASCPLGVNAQAYIALAAVGRFAEAIEVVRRDNILPGICGRVCTHPCEEVCRRGKLDEPIAVKDMKRFLADYELSHPWHWEPPETPRRNEKVAVIGSGPAGLAAAGDLARLGYRVTVFEKEAMAGGLLRYGIGPYRLPRDILDHELAYIQELGVQFMTSHSVTLPGDIEKLKQDFDAIILAIGTWSDRMLGVPGEDLDGVDGCLSFLNRLYQGVVEEPESKTSRERDGIAETLAVIGDGNAAFDLARAVRRLGVQVTILSWFPKYLIPADPEEIKKAADEDISLMDRTQVISFSGQNGKLDHLRCKPTKPGKPDALGIPWPVIVPGSEVFDLKFDRAIVAIGQMGPFPIEDAMGRDHTATTELNLTFEGFVEVGESFKTSIPSVFAAGDAVTGPSSVVEAMASGRAVARSVHLEFCGQDVLKEEISRPDDKDFPEIPEDIPSLARPTMPERQPAARIDNFSEVGLGLNEAQVLFEAKRCLQCGICSECLLCTEACSLVGAVNHEEQSEETIEHAGVVIITDPGAVPPIKGEDVIRAYGPKAAKTDVYAMITRGFAAAARATILLGGASQRPKGHGVSFSPPGPELSPEIRVGIFICRCNDAFGWLDGMDGHVDGLTGQDDVVHAEVVPSICVPEGPAEILRTIREKSVTRVVLASCVCCPLDFVCSACTDQRSRLKDALFKGTGISRAMVETCNLRGEVLRHLTHDPSTALIRFAGLIERSVHRARRLRPLPAPARTYNFATAVIGESEAAVSSAWTLAEAGLEVFMFGTPEKPLSEKQSHPNIQCFESSTVRGISGTLGDFQVFVESDSFSQVLQVGAVVLGEKSRRLIPYIHQEGLPSSTVAASMQRRGLPGTPFLYPGATSIAGLFLADPPGIHVSERKKGAAAAVLAAAIMPRGPRQNKGYTVVVDENRCRGCGRCIQACPHRAIIFHRNAVGGWYAVVDEALCKGCGNCISVCPSNAADSPYRDQKYLEQLLEEVLVQ